MIRNKQPNTNEVIVDASQDSIEQARLPVEIRLAKVNQERANIVEEIKRIDLGLTGYNDAAFMDAQKSIRNKYFYNNTESVKQWVEKKGMMENERVELLRQKRSLEERLKEINDQRRGLQTQKDSIKTNNPMLDTLIRIEKLLEKILQQGL